MNIEKYTQNAQQIVLDCQNIAVAMGNQMVDGEHSFIVDGKPPAKSCGAFDEPVMPNDLLEVDKGLRDFMGLGDDGE